MQVLQFVIGHVDVFSSVLRDRQMDLSLASLQELAITTSVLSRAAAHGQWMLSVGESSLYCFIVQRLRWSCSNLNLLFCCRRGR